jgi:hypothetical protein
MKKVTKIEDPARSFNRVFNEFYDPTEKEKRKIKNYRIQRAELIKQDLGV